MFQVYVILFAIYALLSSINVKVKKDKFPSDEAWSETYEAASLILLFGSLLTLFFDMNI